MQATPTVDATVTELNKDKLAQEVQQLKNQNEQLRNENAPDIYGWLRTNLAILLPTFAVVFGGLFGLWRWIVDREDTQKRELKAREDTQKRELEARRDAQDKELKDRQDERDKRAEERFQSVVTGLGDEKEGAKIGAAILLRTFLRPGYEQFYIQTFDLAVANLRLPGTPSPQEDPTPPLPLTALRQALIIVFKEAFNRLDQEKSQLKIEIKSLDASRIRLDNAYLRGADLKNVQMRGAILTQAELRKTDLSYAYLTKANLSYANLRKAILSGARLHHANLGHAYLREAHLNKAYLKWADFDGADLNGADLREADFGGRALLNSAKNLRGADLRGAKGLTKEQLETCKAKGAIIDEDPTISSSQSPVSPPLPSQSNDVQAPSVPPAQSSTLTLDTGESSAASSEPSSQS